MLPEVRNYLDEVRSHLHLDPVTEKRVIGEICTYFDEKVAELHDEGLPEHEAAREAIKSFGRGRDVARLMYEACSKGNPTEAFLAALPHLLVAGLFLIHLWNLLVLISLTFAFITYVTLSGWWHGKPNWFYPWIGYAMFPLLVAGYAVRPALEQTVVFLSRGHGSLPTPVTMSLTLVFCAFAAGIIIRTTIRVVRRDWVLASLMLAPLPILGTWLFNIERLGGLLQTGNMEIHQWDASMAMVLVMLGIASAIFIWLRQRVLKAGAILFLGVIAGAIAGHNFLGDKGFFGLLAAALLMLLFLLVPALIEARIGHGEVKGEAWWADERLRRPSTLA